MSHLTSMTRVVLIAIPTLCWMSGCKPVADTTSAPLPTQTRDPSSSDGSDATINDPDNPDALVTGPDVTGPDVTGPDVTGPDVTGPDVTGPDVVVPAETDPAVADLTGSTEAELTETDSSDRSSESTDSATTVANDTPDTSGLTDSDATGAPADANDDRSNEAANDQSDEGPLVQQAADNATLTIGQPAPPLQISQWIKGDAVEPFKEEQVYVVEFWATWCGPCLTSMPHLSQLQQEHPDAVTFIGVTREDEDTVREFMAKVQDEESGKTWDEVIQYTIALDLDNETNTAYMRAARQSGIPTAFIIGKNGVIEWIGHPMSIDEPIAQVLSDEWDREAALARLQADRALEKAQQEISAMARRARETGDWTEVIQSVEKMVLKNPDSAEMKILQFNVLLKAEEYEQLNRLVEELSVQIWDDADYLNRLSWQMVTRVPKDRCDMELALKIALRSSELAENNPSVMDTVARVYYEMGDRESAIQWQKRAVEAAPNEKALRTALEKYQADNPEP